jgi:hypothetical protein
MTSSAVLASVSRGAVMATVGTPCFFALSTTAGMSGDSPACEIASTMDA